MHLLCMILEGQVETEMMSCISILGSVYKHVASRECPGYQATMNILSLVCIFNWSTACAHCPLASKLLQDPQVRQSHKVLRVSTIQVSQLFQHEDPPTGML